VLTKGDPRTGRAPVLIFGAANAIIQNSKAYMPAAAAWYPYEVAPAPLRWKSSEWGIS